MYERFTDRARKVMQLANQEAQRLGHEFICTEHILLGLAMEGSGVAANVLKNLDVDPLRLREEVSRIVRPGDAKRTSLGRLPHTPRAKKVIEYSIEEARNLNHNYVGTEHLLLGLLREQEGVAAEILKNLGLKLEDVREEVLNLLGRLPSEGSEGTHRINIALGPEPAPAQAGPAALPPEFAALDAVLAKLTALHERSAAAHKFVEAAWFAEQADLLKQVREAIVRKWGSGESPSPANG